MFWCTLKKKQYENIRNGYKELRRKAPHFWLWMQSLPLPTGSQCLCYTRQMLDRCPSGPLRRQDRLRVYIHIFAICFCQGHTGCACRLFTKLLLGRWVGTGVSRSWYNGSSISAWCRSGAALFSEWYSAILTWIHQSAITIDGLHVDKRLKVQEKCIYMTQPYKWMFWLEPTRLAYNDT